MKSKAFKSIASFVMVMAMVAPMVAVPGKTAEAAPKLSAKSVSLTAGATKTVKVKGAAKKSKFSWKSSNTKVATVAGKAKKAKIKGVAAGTAKVTCTIKKGKKKTLTCKVKVTATVNSVSLSKTSLSIKPGDKPELTVSVNGSSKLSGVSVSWTSSNSKVAKVKKTKTAGKVNVVGLSNGTATITAKVGSKSASCTVKVDGSVSSSNNTTTTNNGKNDNSPKATDKPKTTEKPKATPWKYEDPDIIYQQHFDVTRWYDPDTTGKAAGGNGHTHDGYKNNSFAVWMVGFYDNKYSTNESEYNDGIYGPGLKNYKNTPLSIEGQFKYDGADRKTVLLQINYTSPLDYPIMWKWEKGASKAKNTQAESLQISGGGSEAAKAGEWHNVKIPKFVIPKDAKNGDTDSSGNAYDFYIYFPNQPGGELQYTKDNTFHFKNFKIAKTK